MGQYQAYNIVLDPGPRDPGTVAGELVAALPGTYDAAQDVIADVDHILYDGSPKVWVEDGYVYHATGRNHDVYQPFDWDDVVPRLSVAADWAVATYQQEVESAGGVKLYAWANGQYRPVEERYALHGSYGSEVTRILERTYGVRGRAGRPVDPAHTNEYLSEQSGLAPRSVPGFERIPSSEIRDLHAVLDGLGGGEPAEWRHAANELYALVTDRGQLDEIPPVFATVFEDPVVRPALTATMTELSVSSGEIERAFTAEDRETRRAAARFCVVDGITRVSLEVLREALGDEDRRIRELTARAIDRAAVGHDRTPSGDVIELLGACIDDPSPAVRTSAVIATIRVGCPGVAETRSPSAGAVSAAADSWARAAYDESQEVRTRFEQFLQDVYGRDEFWVRMTDAFLARLPGSIPEHDARSDTEPPRASTPFWSTSPTVIGTTSRGRWTTWSSTGGERDRTVPGRRFSSG